MIPGVDGDVRICIDLVDHALELRFCRIMPELDELLRLCAAEPRTAPPIAFLKLMG